MVLNNGASDLLALQVGVGTQIEQLVDVFLPQTLFAVCARRRDQAMQAVGVVAATLAPRCVQIPITQVAAPQDVEAIINVQRSSYSFVYNALQRAIVQGVFLFRLATLAHADDCAVNPRASALH